MKKGGYADRIYAPIKLEPLAELLPQAGISLELVLRAANVTVADLTSPLTHVSIDQVLAAYEAVIRQANDPLIAYQIGAAFHVTTYGMYGFAMLSSATGARALDIGVDYHQLSTPLVSFVQRSEASGLKLIIEPIPHPRMVGLLYAFVVRVHIGMFNTLYREIVGLSPSLSIGLAFEPAPDELARMAPIEVRRLEKSDTSWIGMDPLTLGRPTAMGSPRVNKMLLEICDAEIEELSRREGVSGQVRTLLITNGCHVLGMQAAAMQLGLTERSLRRRLAEEGTSYRLIQDDVQAQAAIRYLRDTELTVEVIASALGFSDAPNFRRAFRRWTGRAPSEYRPRGPQEKHEA